MDELLDLIDANEVRAALDPTGLLLDATILPPKTILRQVFAGAAMAEVLALDPDAVSREGELRQRIANALNLLTAANIAPFVVQITREKWGDVDTTYQAVDWVGRGGQLRARARAEIATTTAAAAVSVPRIFGVACGRRGAR